MKNVDNQADLKSEQLETSAPNQTPISSAKTNENSQLDFSKLTHQNWLFINAFLSTRDVKKAYELAKYSGKDESAPYQIFKKLKTYIEQIGDLDVTSRARLQANIKELLDIPLLESQKLGVTLKERLEILKLTAKLTPEALQAKPQISMLVINRPSAQPATKNEPNADSNGTPHFGNNAPRDSTKSVVIDAELIDPKP